MWIDLAEERSKWSALVNTVMNPQVPCNAGTWLTGWEAVRLLTTATALYWVGLLRSQSRIYWLKQSTDVFGLVSTVRKRYVEGKEKCISCQIKIGFMKAQNLIGQRQTFIYILRNLWVAPQPLCVIRTSPSCLTLPQGMSLETWGSQEKAEKPGWGEVLVRRLQAPARLREKIGRKCSTHGKGNKCK
jgi:hypothetical protein